MLQPILRILAIILGRYQNQTVRNVGVGCGEMSFTCSSSKMPEAGNAASMMAGLVSLPAAPPAAMSPARLDRRQSSSGFWLHARKLAHLIMCRRLPKPDGLT